MNLAFYKRLARDGVKGASTLLAGLDFNENHDPDGKFGSGGGGGGLHGSPVSGSSEGGSKGSNTLTGESPHHAAAMASERKGFKAKGEKNYAKAAKHYEEAGKLHIALGNKERGQSLVQHAGLMRELAARPY
jgi:hypothetical protein